METLNMYKMGTLTFEYSLAIYSRQHIISTMKTSSFMFKCSTQLIIYYIRFKEDKFNKKVVEKLQLFTKWIKDKYSHSLDN